MAILSPQLLARVRQIRTQVLTDVQAGFSPCTFTAWTKDRPEDGPERSWVNGTAGETWYLLNEGAGMLRANGSGGPVIGEAAIWQQAPYQFRTDVASGIGPSKRLVIDGARLFRVEAAPVEDPEKPIMTAYLTELFGMALPEVTP